VTGLETSLETPAQAAAELAFTIASGRMADVWPLPAAGFLTGIGGGERHAISREWFGQTRRRHWSGYARGECGRPALYASQYPVYGDRAHAGALWCAECSWAVAAQEGDLGRQVRALTGTPGEQAALGRLMGDPLIAANAAARIIDAAERDDDGRRIGAETVRLLAAVTRHAPVILVTEDCADGECGHGPDGIGERCAAVACRACSVQAGPEAGEWEGRFLAECTIPAPCAPLIALAVHAERALAEARRREQELAGVAGVAGEAAP
jgi:hypothetical protein